MREQERKQVTRRMREQSEMVQGLGVGDVRGAGCRGWGGGTRRGHTWSSESSASLLLSSLESSDTQSL